MKSEDIARARANWHWRGQTRPDFAVVPRPGEESVWDYPRPPRVETVARELRLEFAGETIARTTRGLRVLETAGPPVYYFPKEDVRLELLQRERGSSFCEWKGEAAYFSLSVGPRLSGHAAWSYPHPLVGYELLRGCFAFHASRVDAAYVGEERVVPQPGDYYGGWITSEVVGPFKGEAGSENW